jgi:hypothetical protein
MSALQIISAGGWLAVYEGRTGGQPHIIVKVAAFGVTGGSGTQRVVGFGPDGIALPSNRFLGFSQDYRPPVFMREFSNLAEIRGESGR